MKYGNGYVIDWYEGIMSTEEFIDEIKTGYFKKMEVFHNAK